MQQTNFGRIEGRIDAFEFSPDSLLDTPDSPFPHALIIKGQIKIHFTANGPVALATRTAFDPGTITIDAKELVTHVTDGTYDKGEGVKPL